MTDDASRPTVPSGPASTHDSQTSPEPAVRVIGPYRLIQKIGQGGMGEVWEAEQIEPVRRRVALKLIKRGMDTEHVVARFESERQALAMMDHPAIAKVLDAGATERGRPYFVMEYVPGIPITVYCDEHWLDTRERLELFQQVCHGVQHAHQKAIIHRDIKPSNVLVALQDDTPVPKIIDFGVAKATGPQLTDRKAFTELGQMIGTPEYMSPEQAEVSGLNVDTRTDVYSLGAVLYELLAGAKPFDPDQLRERGYARMVTTLRETDPPRPSTRFETLGGERSSKIARARRTEPVTLARQLRGDLDWITMRALEKDRTRRYDSPAALAADIDRYLKDLPVEAGPPRALYRARKFVRRHRVSVTSVAAVLALLVAFAVTMAVQARRIAAERDRANLEAETSRQIAGFLKGLFRVPDPSESRGNTVTAREILDQGAQSIRLELAGQPLVQAELMELMGEVYSNLGLYEDAARLIDDASRVRLDHGTATVEEMAHNRLLRAIVHHEQGDYDASERLAREALKALRNGADPASDDIAASLQHVAMALKSQGRIDEAEPLYREALTHRLEHLTEKHQATASTMTSLAELLRVKGELEESEQLHRRALDVIRSLHGTVHPTTGSCLNNLALTLQAQERWDESEALLRETVEVYRQLYGEENSHHASALNNLAANIRDRKPEEAERLHRQALTIRRELFGDTHPDLASSLNNLAVLLQDKGEMGEAEALMREAVEVLRRLLGHEHPHLGVGLYNLGRLQYRQREYARALESLRGAQPILERDLPAGHWRRGNLRSMIGYCLARTGRYEEAEPLLLEGYEIIRAARGEEDNRTVTALRRIVRVYEAWGRADRADKYRSRLPASS